MTRPQVLGANRGEKNAHLRLNSMSGIIMKPVVQLERTGCGIASVAAIAGLSYPKAKSIANSLGIHAGDKTLWSDTLQVRRLLRHLGFVGSPRELPFRSWDALPDLALLSIKWHLEQDRPYWHWVVFVRESGQAYVLDSKKGLRKNRRTDFGRMKPKWFIPVTDRVLPHNGWLEPGPSPDRQETALASR